METKFESGKLTFFLEGRIDATNSDDFERELSGKIAAYAPAQLTLDCSQLLYISSAGLRAILKKRKENTIPIELTEVSLDVYEILEVTGFTEILDVRRKLREISVDGLPVIGQGFYGMVYRIDGDTIVKVYNVHDKMDMIENEKKKARLAFVKGIPTAISFDIVRVGEDYGSVFELINAKTMIEVMTAHPERTDEIIEKHVALMKQVNETLIEPGILPKAKDIFADYLDVIASYLPEDVLKSLKSLIANVPDDNHLVHGDMQCKNVMISGTEDEEATLIDMDTLCVGQSIFDVYGLYLTYKVFPEDEPDNTMKFSGISPETSDHIWDRFLKLYIGTEDEAVIALYIDRIKVLAYIRFLSLIVSTDLKNGELGALRIKHSVEHLTELVSKVDSLV